MAADARDYFANVFVNQETSSALINLSGFLLDFAPAAGVAGDAAKILPKLADFIIRYVDDAPKVLDAIIQTTKHFPGLERALPDLVHLLPVGVIDNLAKSVKNTENLTQTQYAKILNIVDAAGKNADEVIEATRFKSFKALKNYLGDPGPGNEWHHIVEQCQAKATRSGFDIQDINTVANVRATPKDDVHKAISAYYSSKQSFTDNKTVRDWLNGKSYEEQLQFGLQKWEEYMTLFGYPID